MFNFKLIQQLAISKANGYRMVPATNVQTNPNFWQYR
jgi:hypothetical protein